MDTVMEEKRGTYTALSLSLALHVILLLAAGALGLFSIAVPQTGDTPVEVTLYDAGPPAAADVWGLLVCFGVSCGVSGGNVLSTITTSLTALTAGAAAESPAAAAAGGPAS